jgi:ABC-2 type transport system permease protein
MIVWERVSGILKRLVSTPAPRYMIVVGRSLAAGTRALIQSLVIFVIAALVGVAIILNPLSILLSLLIVLIFAAGFAAFSMSLASVFKSREKFVGIGQLIIFPLFFSSNALYPISTMPTILQWVAEINPMTYSIDAIRGLLITGQLANLPIDLLAVAIFALAMFTLAASCFKSIVE